MSDDDNTYPRNENQAGVYSWKFMKVKLHL